MHRVLVSQQDERRTPIDQRYYDLWLSERANVMRIAQVQLVPPKLEQLIADVDTTMLKVFNDSTAFRKQNDLGYLTLKTIAYLKVLWQRSSVDLDPKLRGTQPMPLFEDTNTPIVKQFLR